MNIYYEIKLVQKVVLVFSCPEFNSIPKLEDNTDN